MKIDSYGPTLIESSKPVNVSSAAKAGKQANAPGSYNPTAEDKTTLSASTQSVQSLTKSALLTAPLRTAKVEALKQTINSAQYQLDTAKIAEAILNGAI